MTGGMLLLVPLLLLLLLVLLLLLLLLLLLQLLLLLPGLPAGLVGQAAEAAGADRPSLRDVVGHEGDPLAVRACRQQRRGHRHVCTSAKDCQWHVHAE